MSKADTRADWQSYTETVKSLARKTIRSWMIGIDVADIENEIWAEFFRLHNVHPEGLARWKVNEELTRFAQSYKKEERAHKFGANQSKNAILDEFFDSSMAKHLVQIQIVWDQMVSKVSSEDAVIMRHLAKGFSKSQIAKATKLSIPTVARHKARILHAFRKEVEDNVQIDFPKRYTEFDQRC